MVNIYTFERDRFTAEYINGLDAQTIQVMYGNNECDMLSLEEFTKHFNYDCLPLDNIFIRAIIT